MNNVLNQNLNETKRARFTTFAISIVDNLYLLEQCKCNTIKIPMPRLIINVPYESSFVTILDFFISNWEYWPLSRCFFGSWGHALVAVAVVERWLLWKALNKSQGMDFLFAGTKKVTVVERWPLVEVRLYIFSLACIHEHCPVINTSNAWKVCLVQLF